MKKILLSVIGLFTAGILSAQTYPYVDINQISFVSATDLAACIDASAYAGDTVVTRGIVIIDGNLSEVRSSSITGMSRPFISLADTSSTGAPGAFQSVIVMGVAAGTSNPVADIENAIAGDILEMTCIVGGFNGQVQLQPLSATAVSLVGATSVPGFTTVPVSDLQDNMRINKLTTGEQWESSYVELQNVTVTSVSVFSSGSRTEFTVEDAAGNQILVADRFLPMKVSGQLTVNPNSPDTVGSFVAPSVGTVYNHIRGLIFQDGNGTCFPGSSSFAGGYEINPFNATDLNKAASPPSISGLSRNPQVPNGTQSVTISADIQDFDGVVTGATLFYTSDQSAAANLFTSVTMTNVGSLYSATIPATPLDSVVRYFIEAIDDSMQVTTNPNTPMGAPLNTHFYKVRANGPTIMDIQTTQYQNNDASPYAGDTITVTGAVSASYQTGDLGYLYIQDTTATEYAGIFVNGGPISVFGLNRGDVITVEGVVEENFNFTRLNAINVTNTGSSATVNATILDPSDAALFGTQASPNLEKYESMLVKYENPAVGGQVYVINPNLGFGEFQVGSGFFATTGARVLSGRQTLGQAQGSLDVSLLSDTALYGAGLTPGVMPIQATINHSMSSLEGILYYSFGNYKLTPRNNADFGNLVVSIQTITNTNVETSIFPNPANDQISVQIDENYSINQLNIQLFDVTGRVVVETQSSISNNRINLSGLERGMYVLKVMNNNELIHSSKVILK